MQADLPATAGSGTYGRATKEAAAMLLAKLYLNAEVYTGTPQYAQALAAAQQVIAGPVHAGSQLSSPVPGRQPHLAGDHLPDHPGWSAHPDLRRHHLPGPCLLRRHHDRRRLRRGRMLVRPAAQAGGVQPLRSAATRGASFFWTDGQTRPESPPSATSARASRRPSSSTRPARGRTAPTRFIPTPTSRCSGWATRI